MAQGAVKKSGKRSQAVSAKRRPSAAALEAFSQFGIHGTRLEQVAERAGVSKTNLLITTLRKRRCMWLSCSRSSPSGWRR